ncbi:MAG TPA: hypothetical protein VJL37_11005 [Flavobacterium sp.]|nr:hypothetical protein [Flavobacterium sp.]
MKKILTIQLLVTVFSFLQTTVNAQDNKVKIYQSKTSESCLVVFPNNPDPLMVVTSSEGCKVVKKMAADDWMEMPITTVISTSIVDPKATLQATSGAIKSPRDASSGLATGKRQHKPILLNDLTLDALQPDTDGDGVEIYSFSWGMSNTGAMSSSSSGASGRKAGYNVKENVKRTASSSNSCCSEGMCTITVSVDRKHTKSGHVTLLK